MFQCVAQLYGHGCVHDTCEDLSNLKFEQLYDPNGFNFTEPYYNTREIGSDIAVRYVS